MILSPEALLLLVALGIYLFDSALLLYRNEAVMYPRRGGPFRVAFGSQNAQLFGKTVFLPNPLRPERPIYRLVWATKPPAVVPNNAQRDWDHREELAVLAPFVWSMFVALFLVLPAGLLTRLGHAVVFAALILLYLNAAVALILLFRRRARLELTGKRFAALAFEALVCIPCAINLVRKVSLGIAVREDLLEAGKRLMSPDDYRHLVELVAAQITEDAELEEEGSTRRRELEDYRASLSKENQS